MKPILSVFFSGASDADGPIAALVSADPGIIFSVATRARETRKQGEALQSVSPSTFKIKKASHPHHLSADGMDAFVRDPAHTGLVLTDIIAMVVPGLVISD
ncbi:MAG: hypothetical protein KKE51_19575 [Gammaproteobacteria bacterium]|nr:hypothetical protein [Gammaproteobacteria bacterium]MBU1603501.1 hypothetical protein [Gammaproteobacteria bacterium]MBU2433021.1 hypothetical protein [Gammaproteobacteria bacterium]MBU2450264.1 hypothetical protein [Gammaproteobacteria bacterium]